MAGRVCDIFPLRRSAILVERFLSYGNEVSYTIKTPGEILFLRTPIFFRASPERLFSFSKTVRHASNRNPYPLPLQLTPPGTLAAHGNFCLVLLCSQPDTVHRHPLRKTQTSSPLIKGSNMSQKPSAYHHPCYSGFQVQGAAAPPAARWLQYNHFPEICQ